MNWRSTIRINRQLECWWTMKISPKGKSLSISHCLNNRSFSSNANRAAATGVLFRFFSVSHLACIPTCNRMRPKVPTPVPSDLPSSQWIFWLIGSKYRETPSSKLSFKLNGSKWLTWSPTWNTRSSKITTLSISDKKILYSNTIWSFSSVWVSTLGSSGKSYKLTDQSLSISVSICLWTSSPKNSVSTIKYHFSKIDNNQCLYKTTMKCGPCFFRKAWLKPMAVILTFKEYSLNSWLRNWLDAQLLRLTYRVWTVWKFLRCYAKFIPKGTCTCYKARRDHICRIRGRKSVFQCWSFLTETIKS